MDKKFREIENLYSIIKMVGKIDKKIKQLRKLGEKIADGRLSDFALQFKYEPEKKEEKEPVKHSISDGMIWFSMDYSGSSRRNRSKVSVPCDDSMMLIFISEAINRLSIQRHDLLEQLEAYA